MRGPHFGITPFYSPTHVMTQIALTQKLALACRHACPMHACSHALAGQVLSRCTQNSSAAHRIHQLPLISFDLKHSLLHVSTITGCGAATLTA